MHSALRWSCLIFALPLTSAYAAELLVPSQYTTIQAAINAASAGDSVRVSAGTYTENITLKSGVSVWGCGASACTIQGDGTSATVMGNQLASSTTIDGFTITGGAGFTVPWSENRIMGGGIFADGAVINIGNNHIISNQAQIGGGIALMNSQFNISSNTISNNQATTNNSLEINMGGGIYLIDSHGDIANNTISQNSVSSGVSNPTLVNAAGNMAPGGGITIVYSSLVGDTTITSNQIANNSASGSQNYGGGIYIYQPSTDLGNQVYIVDNEISDNQGLDGGGLAIIQMSPVVVGNDFSNNSGHWGGGIYGFNGAGIISHNTFSSNDSIEIRSGQNTGGGGILCDEDFTPFISHNTFNGNTAVDYGGGLEVFDSQNSTVVWKNIFQSNSARFGGGAVVSSASPDVLNNYFYDNSASEESGGGLYIETTSSATVKNNIFTENSAGRFGGGIGLVGVTSATIFNNVMYNNSTGWWGGGLYANSGSSLTFYNNIVSNHAEFGVGLDSGTTMTRGYNNFYNNTQHDCYQCPAGNGERTGSPGYADTTSFELAASSNNVDAGNPASTYNDRDNSRNDIGAYGGPSSGDIPNTSTTPSSNISFDLSSMTLDLPDTDLGTTGGRYDLDMAWTTCTAAPSLITLKLTTIAATSSFSSSQGAFFQNPYLIIPTLTFGAADYRAILSLYPCSSDPGSIYAKLEALTTIR